MRDAATQMIGRPIARGTEVAGYRIESVLGEGGMAVVYLATQLRLDRYVALKILSPVLGQDEEFRQRFIRESNAAAALDDPNILPIYDAGEADGYLYIAMRRIDGSDLGGILQQRGRLTPPHVLSIVEQIGGALDAAHRAGLVHRDVKPGNILVDTNGIAYLCDFGLAKHGAVDDLAPAGLFIGTVDFCAPEQIAGHETDGRTDLYALGAVAYHALTGEPPFLRATELETANAHLDDSVPLPSARGLSSRLDSVLETGLAKDPASRFQTGAAFAEALAGALDQETAADDLPPLDPPIAPDDNGLLTDEALRAKLSQGRGPVWWRSPVGRFVTRVFKTIDPRKSGRLTHTVLRERLASGRGPIRWRDLKGTQPTTSMSAAPGDEGGRLTAEVLERKVEEENARRAARGR